METPNNLHKDSPLIDLLSAPLLPKCDNNLMLIGKAHDLLWTASLNVQII
jgi:hypothetical protein